MQSGKERKKNAKKKTVKRNCSIVPFKQLYERGKRTTVTFLALRQTRHSKRVPYGEIVRLHSHHSLCNINECHVIR
jgi:hypothetical protein